MMFKVMIGELAGLSLKLASGGSSLIMIISDPVPSFFTWNFMSMLIVDCLERKE